MFKSVVASLCVLLAVTSIACDDDGTADDVSADADIDGDETADLGEADVLRGRGEVFPNMFAARACNAQLDSYLLDSYCGGATGGSPADFDAAAFESLYLDLDDDVIYPNTGPERAYTRLPLPLCEDGTNVLDQDGTCKNDGKEPIRCTDGTRPIAWVRMPDAQSTHANDWLLRVQGGDDTCGTHPGETNCYAYAESHQFSSAGTNLTRDAGGIFWSDPPAGAPPFDEFGSIFMDKCVGDRNLGDNRIDDYQYYRAVPGIVKNGPLQAAMPLTDAGRGPVYFHGRRMLRAIINRLAAENHLLSGSRLVVIAQSNGSNGLYQYLDAIDAVADSATDGDVDVRGAPSSYVRSSLLTENYLNTGALGDFTLGGRINAPSSSVAGLEQYNQQFAGWGESYLYEDGVLERSAHDAVLGNDAFLPGGLEAQRFEDWGADPDVTCSRNHDRWMCLDSQHILAGYLETPTFVAVQTADFRVRLAHHLFAGSGNSNLFGVTYHPHDFEVRALAMVERLDALEAGNGAFVTHTDDHHALSETSKVVRQIGGVSLAQALYDWIVAPPGTESFCVSLPPNDATQRWYHYDRSTSTDGYVDTGHDTAFACPGSTF